MCVACFLCVFPFLGRGEGFIFFLCVRVCVLLGGEGRLGDEEKRMVSKIPGAFFWLGGATWNSSFGLKSPSFQQCGRFGGTRQQGSPPSLAAFQLAKETMREKGTEKESTR